MELTGLLIGSPGVEENGKKSLLAKTAEISFVGLMERPNLIVGAREMMTGV